jgi:hypothetical protein
MHLLAPKHTSRMSLTHSKEAFTRSAGGDDLSIVPEARAVDFVDETCREYETVDPKYLVQLRPEAKQSSTKLLSRSSVLQSAISKFKKGSDTIKPLTLRKLSRAIHFLQNRK